MTTITFADTLIAAMNATKANSDSNAKKKSALALIARNEKVAALLEECNVNARDFNDLYLADKVLKVAQALVKTDLHIRDFQENSFAALKTAVLCANASRDMTRNQVRATIDLDTKISADDVAVTYRRNARMCKRQQDLNIRLLETLKIAVSRDSKEILKIDAENAALKICQERIANMSL